MIENMEESILFNLNEDTNQLSQHQQQEADPFDFFIKQDDDTVNYEDILSDIDIESFNTNAPIDILSQQNTTASLNSEKLSQFSGSDYSYNNLSPPMMTQTSYCKNQVLQDISEKLKPKKEPRKIYKKTIQKKKRRKTYEPLNDNGKTYVYENNPTEYMKVRKRVQSRISAIRVRSRNKKYQKQVDHELRRLIDENGQLKIRNAQLKAENTILKQQAVFLESVIMNSNKISAQDKKQAVQAKNLQSTQSPLLPIVMPPKEQKEMNLEEQSIDKKYIPNVVTNNGQQYIYRIGKKPQHPTRHFMLFGIFTILIFIYGMQKVDGEVGLTQPDFTNSGGLTPQGFETNNSNGLTSSVTNWEQQIQKLIKENNSYRLLKSLMWYFSLLSYIVYVIFLVFQYQKWRCACLKQHFKFSISRSLLGGVKSE